MMGDDDFALHLLLISKALFSPLRSSLFHLRRRSRSQVGRRGEEGGGPFGGFDSLASRLNPIYFMAAACLPGRPLHFIIYLNTINIHKCCI